MNETLTFLGASATLDLIRTMIELAQRQARLEQRQARLERYVADRFGLELAELEAELAEAAPAIH